MNAPTTTVGRPFPFLLTNQRQHHAAGDVSNKNYDQRRDYGEGDAPLRIRRLLAGGGYYVEAYEGVETRRRAGENLLGRREICDFSHFPPYRIITAINRL